MSKALIVAGLSLLSVALQGQDVGNRVRTLASVNVRSEPRIDPTTFIGAQPSGVEATVLEVGPTTVNGTISTTWYRLDFANDPDGWVGHNNLEVVVAPDLPRITLTWKDNSNNELGFIIERSVGNGEWGELTRVGANVQTYVDAGLARGTTYSYKVRAFNKSASGSEQYSGYTNTASHTTSAADVPLPADPTVLELQSSDTVTAIELPPGSRLLVTSPATATP